MDDSALISTKAEPGPFDGFEKAAPDEPIFTLLGRDEDAPIVVQEWVDRRRERAVKLDDPHLREAELRQCVAAEQIAWAMTEYRKDWKPPEVAPDYYSGSAPDEEAKREIDRHDALKRAHSKLHNALAEANGQEEALAALGGVDAHVLRQIREAVYLLRVAAAEISPKRPVYRREESDGN